MTKFETKCRAVAEELSLDGDWVADSRPRDQFEDDGALHVVSGRGQRFYFQLDQDDPSYSNEMVERVLDKLGIKKYDRNRVLVDEPIDDDCCPNCGCDCGNW